MREHALAWLFTKAGATLFRRVQSTYQRKFQHKLQVVLIAGNVGKSTATLMVADLLRASGKTVLTGTEPERNLNTPMGFVATLLDRKELLNNGFKGLSTLFIASFFGKLPTLNRKTVLVYECGVDQQHGANRYLKIFKSVDIVVLPVVAIEHSQNFSNTIDQEALRNTLRIIPHIYREQLVTINDPILKNCVIEQLKFTTIAKTVISPKILGSVGKKMIVWSRGKSAKEITASVRTRGTQLALAGSLTPEKYLLPSTFVVFGAILIEISRVFKIPKKLMGTTIENLTLPYSRFSKFEGKAPFSQIVDSTYNSDPESLNGFLDLLDTHAVQATHHCLILGEMRELGVQSDRAHEAIIKRIITMSEYIPMSVYLVGSEWVKPNLLVMWSQYNFIHHAQQVNKLLPKLQTHKFPKKSWMWCKGSQNTLFLEEVVKAYLKKKEDSQFLCRQSEFYLEKKAQYTSLDHEI